MGDLIWDLIFAKFYTNLHIRHLCPNCRPPYHRKAVFDLGEYGIGFNADRQVLNQDVVGAVVFIDGVLNNSTGDPVSYPRIITVRHIFSTHFQYTGFSAVELCR